MREAPGLSESAAGGSREEIGSWQEAKKNIESGSYEQLLYFCARFEELISESKSVIDRAGKAIRDYQPLLQKKIHLIHDAQANARKIYDLAPKNKRPPEYVEVFTEEMDRLMDLRQKIDQAGLELMPALAEHEFSDALVLNQIGSIKAKRDVIDMDAKNFVKKFKARLEIMTAVLMDLRLVLQSRRDDLERDLDDWVEIQKAGAGYDPENEREKSDRASMEKLSAEIGEIDKKSADLQELGIELEHFQYGQLKKRGEDEMRPDEPDKEISDAVDEAFANFS